MQFVNDLHWTRQNLQQQKHTHLIVHGIAFAEAQTQRRRPDRFLVDLFDVLGEAIAKQRKRGVAAAAESQAQRR